MHVVTTEKLSLNDLLLVAGPAGGAIRVPNILSEGMRAEALESLAGHDLIEYLAVTSDGSQVRSGTYANRPALNSFYRAVKDPGGSGLRDYKLAWGRDEVAISQAVNIVVLELEKIWPWGVARASLNGEELGAGVIRVNVPTTTSPYCVEPHVDAIPPDILSFECQLSLNLYLKAPQLGGEVLIWSVPDFLVTESLLNAIRRNAVSPHKSLRIEAGDLLIINTRVPHAVGSFAVGERMSLNVFCGINLGEKLSLWS